MFSPYIVLELHDLSSLNPPQPIFPCSSIHHLHTMNDISDLSSIYINVVMLPNPDPLLALILFCKLMFLISELLESQTYKHFKIMKAYDHSEKLSFVLTHRNTKISF